MMGLEWVPISEFQKHLLTPSQMQRESEEIGQLVEGIMEGRLPLVDIARLTEKDFLVLGSDCELAAYALFYGVDEGNVLCRCFLFWDSEFPAFLRKHYLN